jgi:glycosyltransferase involved in cell wall biosynthesis
LSHTVSVVIPCYNGSRFLGDALGSIAAQTRPVHEVIVVDDGSRAEEAEAIDRAGREAAIACRIIHLPRNRGVCVARNIGVVRATGSHVAFLDCDDLWAPGKNEEQLRFLHDNPEYVAVHCGLRVISGDGRELVVHKTEIRFDDLVEFPCPVFPSAFLCQREALFECGLFDPTKRVCEDLDLFLRFTSQYPIGCVDQPLMIRRVQADGASRNLGAFHHDADRVYRDFRYVFEDRAAAADTLVDLHADFLKRAVYARDASFFWRVLRRATRNDVTVPRVLLRAAQGLVRDRRDKGKPA